MPPAPARRRGTHDEGGMKQKWRTVRMAWGGGPPRLTAAEASHPTGRGPTQVRAVEILVRALQALGFEVLGFELSR
jgi:hypothetical protein